MHSVSRLNQSEIAKAESTLKTLEANHQNLKSMISEKKSERHHLETQPAMLEATGDINKLMILKRRIMELDKELVQLGQTELECRKRVESVKQYIFTLNSKLNSLRAEAAKIKEKLDSEELPPDISAQLKTFLKRVQIQIEAIAGTG
jgi:chromosome segregation ATPase